MMADGYFLTRRLWINVTSESEFCALVCSIYQKDAGFVHYSILTVDSKPF